MLIATAANSLFASWICSSQRRAINGLIATADLALSAVRHAIGKSDSRIAPYTAQGSASQDTLQRHRSRWRRILRHRPSAN
jgi:hypothetical protein